jgi:hypothetical protein
MRILTQLAALTLGTGLLPGTAGEALDYAMREAESPEAQEFVGGDGPVFLVIVLVGMIVVVVCLLVQNGEKV